MLSAQIVTSKIFYLSKTGGLYLSRFFCVCIPDSPRRTTGKENHMGHNFGWTNETQCDVTSQIIRHYSNQKWPDLLKLLAKHTEISSPEIAYIKAILSETGFIGFNQSTNRSIGYHQQAKQDGCPYSEAHLVAMSLDSENQTLGFVREIGNETEEIYDRVDVAIENLMPLSRAGDHEATAAMGELLLMIHSDDGLKHLIGNKHRYTIPVELRRASDEGSASCAGYLSALKFQSSSFSMSKNLLDWLLHAHKLGDEYSSIALGYYLCILGEKEDDFKHGATLLFDAARNGSVAANMAFGKMIVEIANGECLNTMEGGLKYICKAAAFGSPIDKYRAGQFFDPRKPRCAKPDPTIAAKLYEQAAMGGFPGISEDVSLLRAMNGGIQ